MMVILESYKNVALSDTFKTYGCTWAKYSEISWKLNFGQYFSMSLKVHRNANICSLTFTSDTILKIDGKTLLDENYNYRADTGSQTFGVANEILHHDFLPLSLEVFSCPLSSSWISPSAIKGRKELGPRREETE